MKGILIFIITYLALSLNLYSESISISGFVFDTKKEPIAGVHIQIRGSLLSTTSNTDGSFRLVIPLKRAGKDVKLEFSKPSYRFKFTSLNALTDEFITLSMEKSKFTDTNPLAPYAPHFDFDKIEDVNTDNLIEYRGVVKDSMNKPVANADVILTKRRLSTTTDSKGRFKILIPDSTLNITVKKVGWELKNLDISHSNKENVIELKKLEYSENNYQDDPLMPTYERPGILSRLGLKKDKTTTTPPPSSDRTGGTTIAMRSHTSVEADEGYLGSPIDWSPEKKPSPSAQAGLLTAGEVNDFSKWEFWTGIAARDLATYSEFWAIKPEERYTIQLENSMHNPIVNVKVRLLNNNDIIWQARTDNTGKAELWANPYTKHQTEINELSIEVEYENKIHKLTNIKKFQDGINFLKIEAECNYPKNIDIAFVVDATGSMDDELDYLKAELADIIHKVKDSLPDFDLKVSVLFYRDVNDDYLTRHIDFTSDVDILVSYISTQIASAGGDTPEAVDAALEQTLNNMSWRENTLSKMLFLILDAPPHHTDNSRESLLSSISQFSEMGVRIIPLACSGMGKSTEYLMRSYSLLTNGTYLFLTDDSGIGGKHIEPTTDEYTVKLLNDLLFRTIYRFAYIPECKVPEIAKQDTLMVVAGEKKESRNDIIPSDENIVNQDNQVDLFAKEIAWKYYPNPTDGILNIELSKAISELFITDITGKIIYRLNNITASPLIVNLTEYPNGIYFIRYEYSPDEWISGKFLISR
jgi:hypothetical protein